MFRNGMEILYEEEGRGYLGLSFEPFMKEWVMHTSWNPELWGSTAEILNIIRHCLKLKPFILDELKSRGITQVVALCATEKEVKFNKLWGMVDTGLVAFSPEGIRVIILKLEV